MLLLLVLVQVRMMMVVESSATVDSKRAHIGRGRRGME